jgi:N-acetyl-gamma-glutamyl-phosphate reductase
LKKYSYPEWYGFAHNAEEWLKKSEYALFPWKKPGVLKSGEVRLIANPGCFPTSVLMALLPTLKSELVNTEIISIDSKSGTTGAGRKADIGLLFSEIFGEFSPYKVGKHQHWPEIVEATQIFAGLKINPIFLTELLPIERGISSALFFRWHERTAKDPDRLKKLQAYIAEAYQSCPDVKVGNSNELLSLKSVVGTNHCHLYVQEAYGQPLVVSVIDNLVRGAAGQALINANLLAGISPFQNLENTVGVL